MDSIATELMSLIRLAGEPIYEQRRPVPGHPDTTEVRLLLPDAVRDTRYRMTGEGTIAITVPGDKCFVAVEITSANIDLSATNTVQIGTTTSPGVAQELQLACNGQCLYVFGPKAQAQFVFVFRALPMASSAPVEVRGFFFPTAALNRLKRIATLVMDV